MASVIVINTDGQNLGLMDYRDASNLARNQELDLVEVGKNGHLQVFKIMNKGKWLFEKKKAEKKSAHHHAPEQKEMRFGIKIEKHDEDIKVKHIREFLQKGHSVQIVVFMKGREKQFVNTAMEKIQNISDSISDIAKLTPIKKLSEDSSSKITVVAMPSVHKPMNQPIQNQPNGVNQ